MALGRACTVCGKPTPGLQGKVCFDDWCRCANCRAIDRKREEARERFERDLAAEEAARR